MNKEEHEVIVRKADPIDLNGIAKLYDAVIDQLDVGINYPHWLKGVYPTIDDAAEALSENTLYVASVGNDIAGSFILRSRQEPGYENADWNIDLPPEQVKAIYTLCIHPDYQHMGIGLRMMEQCILGACKRGIKALRLDAVHPNPPADRLYRSAGFEHIGIYDLGYEQKYGIKWYDLYQMIL